MSRSCGVKPQNQKCRNDKSTRGANLRKFGPDETPITGPVYRVTVVASSQNVTGPSFTSATCMCAPNSPVATSAWRRRASSTRVPNSVRRLRVRGGAESGACALVGVGGQRELRHQQQAAADIGERQIHAPGLVFEDPVAEHALEQAFGAAPAASSRWTPMSARMPRPMLPTMRCVDGDLRLADPLNQCYQLKCSLTRAARLCPVAIARPSP